MRYSYDFKVKCVEMYRQGKWMSTPEGVRQEQFRKYIREWFRRSERFGIEYLQPKESRKIWTAEERYELVAKVLAGQSNKSVARETGINDGQLYQWVQKYKMKGYEGLASLKKGRKPKGVSTMSKKEKPKELTLSEREEMLRLKAENMVLRAELETIKKSIALSRERWDEQLKAKKQKSSKKSKSEDSL